MHGAGSRRSGYRNGGEYWLVPPAQFEIGPSADPEVIGPSRTQCRGRPALHCVPQIPARTNATHLPAQFHPTSADAGGKLLCGPPAETASPSPRSLREAETPLASGVLFACVPQIHSTPHRLEADRRYRVIHGQIGVARHLGLAAIFPKDVV